MSRAVSFAPEVSNAVQGTQEGIIMNTESGSHSVWSSMYRMPSAPQTFAISWQSAITAVVPFESTVSANREGCAMLDSICTWLLIRPGQRKAPPASISVRPL